MRVTRLMEPALWRWGLRFLENCTRAAHDRNSDRMFRLARFGRDTLQEVEAETGIAFHQAHDGAYYLYFDTQAFVRRCADLDKAGSTAFTPLSASELAARDPAFSGFQAGLAGGLLSDIDASGDCRIFTTGLVDWLAREKDVTFRFGCAVRGFDMRGGKVRAVQTDREEIACDHVVLAAGTGTPRLARQFGARVPIYPVKGYPASYPIRDAARIPARPFVDETNLVAVNRLGQVLRVTAIAEFAGHDRSILAERTELIDSYVRTRFDGAVDFAGASYWAGLRPTTPEGTPYIGRLKHSENAWINAGHGQLGWTMAAGAGQVLAAKIDNKAPPVADVSAKAGWLAD